MKITEKALKKYNRTKKSYYKQSPKASYLYLLDFGEYVKIGITKDWKSRKKFYDGLPWDYKIKYVKWLDNANIIETNMIKSWFSFRTRSGDKCEWFAKRKRFVPKELFSDTELKKIAANPRKMDLFMRDIKSLLKHRKEI